MTAPDEIYSKLIMIMNTMFAWICEPHRLNMQLDINRSTIMIFQSYSLFLFLKNHHGWNKTDILSEIHNSTLSVVWWKDMRGGRRIFIEYLRESIGKHIFFEQDDIFEHFLWTYRFAFALSGRVVYAVNQTILRLFCWNRVMSPLNKCCDTPWRQLPRSFLFVRLGTWKSVFGNFLYLQ